MAKTENAARAVPVSTDVLVIGAGFAGLYAHYKVRQIGLTCFGFEAGDGVGGTWYWNRYPGARCDVESLDYTYSFSAELLNEWHWSERYASQPEILDYANHVADRFDLRRNIAFETRVTSASFDEEANQWRVQTDRGDDIVCRYLIGAVGCLSLPKPPEIQGLDDFEGRWVQTGAWPREPVELAEKRIAVIGTGSSGVQSIPVLAEQAAHLTVFQRTANFIIPAHNGPIDPAREAEVRADYVDYCRRSRFTRGGIIPSLVAEGSALDASEDERRSVYQQAWQLGTFALQSVYKDITFNPNANATVVDFVHEKIRGKVKDPAVAEKLLAKDHPFGTKRLCLDTGYFETYNRDNVELIDLRETPIERITRTGIKTTAREYPFDLIVFATGFDAMTGPLVALNITGRGGLALADAWRDGPASYLGLTIAGFPNLFTVNGPSSPSVLVNMIPAIEQHVDLIVDCISYMEKNGFVRCETEEQAQSDWAEEVAMVAERTLFTKANSWYMGANVPGKPRMFLVYIGGFDRYIERCDAIVREGYTGLRFIPGSAAQAPSEARATV